jgi:ethanolaminephosphotransferase
MQMFTSDAFEKRSATVGSFYIHDYDQIDKKVTQKVMEEIGAKNWEVLIAHYLGLDHIGKL